MKALEMIEIYDHELQLVTERIRSEKPPSEIIASIEDENMSEHPLLCRPALQMSGETIVWDL